MTTATLSEVKDYLLNFQNHFITTFAEIENPKNILHDKWHKDAKQTLRGHGTSIVIEGEVIERGGVNFSHVTGDALPTSASLLRVELAGKPFQALGVSIVMHPYNPLVPTAHANIRLFTVQTDENPDNLSQNIWWFGGGFDLTPFYPIEEDIIYWHQQAKQCCQPYGEHVYADFKKQCDDYFYLKHRDETRGIGGLFFDDLNDYNGWPFERAFTFIKQVADTFLESYNTLVTRHYQKTFSQQQKDFQLYRRGRYVEFNLLYDRGTIFGLQSGGRTESILMSMPKNVSWQYNYQPAPNSPESQLTDYLKPREWLK